MVVDLPAEFAAGTAVIFTGLRMNWVHLHLALNHVPVLGTFFVGLLLGAGLIRNSEELKRCSLIGFVALALVSIPIKFTGDFANERLVGTSWLEADRVGRYGMMPGFKTSTGFGMLYEMFMGQAVFEVVPDGVGVAYSIKRDSCQFNVAALAAGSGVLRADAPEVLCHLLEESLLEMRELTMLEADQQPRAKL